VVLSRPAAIVKNVGFISFARAGEKVVGACALEGAIEIVASNAKSELYDRRGRYTTGVPTCT
jgi:hypothetical protein